MFLQTSLVQSSDLSPVFAIAWSRAEIWIFEKIEPKPNLLILWRGARAF